MIADTLNHLERYISLHPGFEKMAQFLQQTDLTTLDVGRYEIDGDNLFVNINSYETQPNKKVEFHKKYIDVQIVLSGQEQIGWIPTNLVSHITPYDDEKDIAFGTAQTDKLTAKNDRFFIFFPEDAHQPGLAINAPSQVKKAVFKVKL